MITQAINLNLIPGQVLPRVNVSQYDSGTRTLRMTLFNGEQIFNVPSGASGYIQGTKPDRTGFQYAATVTAGSNIVTIDITQQMTAVKGEVVCELVLANGSDRIATVNFIIYVEPAALADDTVISETDLPLVEQAAELAQEIEAIAADVEANAEKAEAYGAGTIDGDPVPSTNPAYQNNAQYYAAQAAASAAQIGDEVQDAEAWAVGERGGVPVTSGDDTYHNNSKYYAGEAHTDATAASTSAGNANTDALKAEGFAVGEQNGTAVTSGSPYYHNNAEYFAGEASTSATNASTSETNAGLSESAAAQSEEDSEAWAVGERNGVPVTSGDPTYQNNAKYYAQQAGGTALSSLVDVAISSAQNGDVLAYNSTSTKWENKSLGSAAAKNSTNAVTSGSTDLVESGAVASAITTLTNSDDAMLNVLGAKNLLPNNSKTQTINGVTFTVNSDGSITANGTVTGTYASFHICTMALNKGRYKLSGCPSGFTSPNVAIHCDTINVDDFGEGNEFEIASDSTAFNVKFNAAVGVTFNNTVIKPMIRPAGVQDSTYVPYAMTNRELTANVTPQATDIRTSLNTLLQAADSDFSTQAVWLTTYGELKVLSGRISVASAKDYHYTINVSSIIPKPKNITNFPCMGTDLIAGGCMMLQTNGELVIRIKSTGASASYFDFNGVYV